MSASMAVANYDLVVIGSGPGGYIAAVRGAHHGLKTAIVEKDSRLGGTCLLRGCIPTKALLHSADLLDDLRDAKAHGIVAGEVSFDFAGVQKARAKVVTKSAAGVTYLMKQNQVDVYAGFGRLADATTVVVTRESDEVTTLRAKHVVLATGSKPTVLPFLEVDGTHVVTSDEILELKEPPGSLLVLGAGAVGVEFASVYSRFGSTCTVVEMLDRPLPIEDEEISEELRKAFKKRRIDVRTGTKLENAEVRGKGKTKKVVATLAGPDGSSTLEVDMVLVAVGRSPLTRDIGLEALGVKMNPRGLVEVDGMMRTSVPNVYAIGDIVPTPALAHVATHEALVAVDHLSGREPRPLDYLQSPSCTYCDPEVASVGLTEAQAKERGYTIKVGRFPFAAAGKARIMGKLEGFVKIVADAQYDEILGVHIIGPRATDLIAEACVALRTECTAEELAHTIHAHPTLPEAIGEAAHAAAEGRALNI